MITPALWPVLLLAAFCILTSSSIAFPVTMRNDLGIPSNAASKIQKKDFSINHTFEEWPNDLLDKVISLLPQDDIFNLSQTSKQFHELTVQKRTSISNFRENMYMIRNRVNLQRVRTICRDGIYFKLTLNGQFLFRLNYYNGPTASLNILKSFDKFKNHHKCVKELLNISDLVKKRLDILTLDLPDGEFDETYFNDLGKLLRLRTFELIRVEVNRETTSHISPLQKHIEKRLLDTLASAKIQKIDFRIPLSNPGDINSTMVEEVSLIPYSEVSDSYGRLNGLKDLDIKPFGGSESLWNSFFKTIYFESRPSSNSEYLTNLSINRYQSHVPFNFSVLKSSPSLTRFSFTGRLEPFKYSELFEVIANHKTLSRLSLDVFNSDIYYFTEVGFMEFYTQLISSILKNSENKFRLKTVYLRTSLYDESFQKNFTNFMHTFGEATAPLIGKGITLNGIPIERVVKDLTDGVERRFTYNTFHLSSMY